MFYLNFIILSNYLKEQEKQEIHCNYQEQNEYQHLTLNLGLKLLVHVPPQIPYPTFKFPLNSKEIRTEKGLPCLRSSYGLSVFHAMKCVQCAFRDSSRMCYHVLSTQSTYQVLMQKAQRNMCKLTSSEEIMRKT